MPTIHIHQPISRFAQFQLQFSEDLHIGHREQCAIVGGNGSGKTLLVHYLLGKIALKSGSVSLLNEKQNCGKTQDCSKEAEQACSRQDIKYLAFKDIYQLSSGFDQYYQKRWNATENEESPLVSAILGKSKSQQAQAWFDNFQIDKLLEKRLIHLSSGEMRKLQLVEILLHKPKLLIIDNPFIGLDAAAREKFNQTLQQLIQEKGLQVILVLCQPQDLPSWIDSVVPMREKTCLAKRDAQTFLQDKELHFQLFPELAEENLQWPEAASQTAESDTATGFESDTATGSESNTATGSENCPAEKHQYDYVLKMNNVGVRYYQKQIFSGLHWEVKRGEKWALLGGNGSGKSTLLSLVCGDHPQAYANDISLFDRKRGSGESIWSIKQHIGYISPEMHQYYRQDISCLKVVASGFFDTIGLYRQANETQLQKALAWMRTFHADHLAERAFLQCSYGEQRLVLLVRVFVKEAEVIILDEALHGLDAGKKKLALELIEAYCRKPNTSLIYVTHYEDEIPPCVNLRKIIQQ